MKIFYDRPDTITSVEFKAKAPEHYDELPMHQFQEEVFDKWFDHENFRDIAEYSFEDGIISATIEFYTTAKRTEYVYYDGWTEGYADFDEDSWLVWHTIPKELLIYIHQSVDLA